MYPFGVGRRHERRAGFEARELCAAADNREAERPISTAKVKYPLTRLGLQQFHYRRRQVGHKTGVSGIAFRLPLLACGRRQCP
jgi:hypothetical protein